jgi:hypothetical protein
MPPKKRAAQPYVPSPLLQTLALEEPATKHTVTEDSVTKAAAASDRVLAELVSSSTAVPSESAAKACCEQSSSAVPLTMVKYDKAPRTLNVVVIYEDHEQNYRILENSSWFPEDFDHLWGRDLSFFMPNGLTVAEKKDWLLLIRQFYGKDEHIAKNNPLFGVTDMAERKRILADTEACKKFFAEKKRHMDNFDLADLTESNMHEPTPGQSCTVIVRYSE